MWLPLHLNSQLSCIWWQGPTNYIHVIRAFDTHRDNRCLVFCMLLVIEPRAVLLTHTEVIERASKQACTRDSGYRSGIKAPALHQPRDHSTTNNQSKHYPRLQIPPTHIINPVRLLQAEFSDSSTAAMRPVQEMLSSCAREAKPRLKCGLPSKLCDWFHLLCTLPPP